MKTWITINEPWNTAYLGYGVGTLAPGVVGPGNTSYIAGHNLLRSHAKAYRLYQRKYKLSQNGKQTFLYKCATDIVLFYTDAESVLPRYLARKF